MAHLLMMHISRAPPRVERAPDSNPVADRRRGGRQEFDNRRLMRLLPDPLAGPVQTIVDLPARLSKLEPEPFSLALVVLTALTLWGPGTMLVFLPL